MPDRYTWEAVVDTRQAVRSIQSLPDELRRAFSNVRIDIIDQAAINGARNALRTVTNDFTNTQSQMTGAARDQSQQRVNVAQDELNRTSQLARAFGRVRIQQEQEVTSAVVQEADRRRRAQESQSSLDRTGFNLKDAAVGGVLGYLSVQGARQVLETAKNIAVLDTTVSRASRAFETLQGSAEKADRVLRAIQSASGGTVSELQAMEIANQATSLGLAKTTAEFSNLTRAARAVTFVSPVIHDVQSAISELGLAAANLSFRRLDQLGLSVSEVKERMAALQSANADLDDSQAFLQASVDALNAKFGPLLDSVEAQASGVERLSTAWANFTASLANGNVGDSINHALGQIADGIDRFNAAVSGDNTSLQSIDKLKGLAAGQANPTGDAARFGVDLSGVEAQFQRLIALYDQANEKITAGVPGVQQYLDQINVLIGQAVQSGQVTDEMASKMLSLEGALYNVAGALNNNTLAGQAYAKANEELGASFVSGDERAQGLVAALVNLEIQKQQGLLTAGQYAASINAIAQTFAMLRGEALTAAAAVAGLNAQLGAAVSGGGIGAAVSLGKITSSIQATTATQRLIGSSHSTGEDARIRNVGQAKLDQAAAEKEARAAASAAKKAAAAGTKAFNQAASEMQSLLNSVIKVSQVTQDDIDDAKLGIYKEKPDEYLRQLRDEVLNGKDYKDVSIEDAAEGLNKIGIETVGKSKEAILKLFEQAFGNMSLFADESNLKFLNDAAVNEQIRLQELAKKGQENVFKHFGGVVESAVSAAMGGVSYSGGGGAADSAAAGSIATPTVPTITIDGTALDGGELEITATITALALADDVEEPKVTVSATITAYEEGSKVTTPTPTVSASISEFKELSSAARPIVAVGATITAYGERTDAEKPTPTVSAGITSFLESATAEKPTPTVSAGITKFLESSTAEKPTPTLSAGITKFLESSTAEKPTPTVEARMVFSSTRVDFPADEAELVNTRLNEQIKLRINLGDPDRGGFTLLPADALRISTALEDAIAPKIDMGEIGRIFMSSESATAIQTALAAAITPHITPIIDTPTPESLNLARTAIQNALNGTGQASTGPTPLGQIGTIGNQGGGGSSIAQQYVTDLVGQFSAPENVSQLLGIGTQARSTIDTGFLINTDSTVGGDFVVMMQRQIFTENNIATLLATGGSVFAFIIAGFRNAMNDKNNKVGQEVVDTIAAQVIETQTKAVKEDQ